MTKVPDSDIRFRVLPPRSGRWFCYDLQVIAYGRERIFTDVHDDSTWFRRLWWRFFR